MVSISRFHPHLLTGFIAGYILLAAAGIPAQTLIGGSCVRDTTFTAAKGPYKLSGALNIYNCTVTFEHGATVDLNGSVIAVGYSAKAGALMADGVTFINSAASATYLSFTAGSGGTVRKCSLDNVYVYIVTGTPDISSCTFKNVANPFRFNGQHAHPSISGNTFEGLADPRILLYSSFDVTASDTLKKYDIPYALYSGMSVYGGTLTIEPGTDIDLRSGIITVGSTGKPGVLVADKVVFRSSGTSDAYLSFVEGSGGTLSDCTLDNVCVSVENGRPSVIGNTIRAVKYPLVIKGPSAEPVFIGNTLDKVEKAGISIAAFTLTGSDTLYRRELPYELAGSIGISGGNLTIESGISLDMINSTITVGTSGKPGMLIADGVAFSSSSTTDHAIVFAYTSAGMLTDCTFDNVYVAIAEAAPTVAGCTFTNVDCPFTFRHTGANPSLSNLKFGEGQVGCIGLESTFSVSADFTLKNYSLGYRLLAAMTVSGCTFTVPKDTHIDLYGRNIMLGQSSKPARLVADGAFFTNSGANDQYVRFDYTSGGTLTGCTFDNVYLNIANGNPSVVRSNFLETAKGIVNTSGQALAAENNYWGDPSGPAHASNPGGKGVGVSDNVDYIPWLTAFATPGVVAPAPSAVLDPVIFDLSTGESRSLTFRLKNTGGAADSAVLGLSFSPNLDVSASSPSAEWTRYGKGAHLPIKTGGDSSSRYLAYEWRSSNFGTAERTVSLMVNRTDSGPAWIRYKLIMNPSGVVPYRYHTWSVFPDSGDTDQQGWHSTKLDVREPLGVALTSIGQQKFFVYMNAAVDTFGVGLPGLSPSSFAIYEDGKLQTDRFSVIAPESGGGVRLVDIVFIMDNSGSMSGERNAIRDNVRSFVDSLTASGADFALGLCRYGASNASVVTEDNGALTADVGYFTTTLWNRNITSGSVESGYLAIKTAAQSFNFRPGARRIFIILTDETPAQGNATLDDAITACTDNSITLYALTTASLFGKFSPVTDVTSGACYAITSSFTDILSAISTRIAHTYLVSYVSTNPHVYGMERTVELRVFSGGQSAKVTKTYIPGAEPEINRTPETISLHRAPVLEHSVLEIAASITDRFTPFVESATLYYRRTGQASFATVPMRAASGDSIWRAAIPVDAVGTPGVDYYIGATDGQGAVSDPVLEPIRKPYQIAVLPNVAPRITHVPVSVGETGKDLAVTATVVDSTNSVASVTLSYKRTGQLVYKTVDMTAGADNLYTGVIPAASVTSEGVEYYIRAVDNFGLGRYEGTPSMPLTVVTGAYGVAQATIARIACGPANDTVEVPVNGSGYLYWSFLAGTDSVLYDGDIRLVTAKAGSIPVNLKARTVSNGILRVEIPGSVLGADSAAVFTLPASIAAGDRLYRLSSTASFTAVKKDVEFERTWDVFAGGSAGVSGSVGSVGAGPSVAAAKLSVKGEGGMGLTFKRDGEGNFTIGRRLEAGVGMGAEVPSINLGVDEVGITGITLQLMNKGLLGQSFCFTGIGLTDSERKMAQTGLILETLSLGGVALSPVVGIFLSAVVTTINGLADVSHAFDDAKRETYWGLGVEGSVGAGVSMNVGDVLKLTFAQATAGFALHGKYIDRYGFPGASKYTADVYGNEGGDVFLLKPAKFASASFLGKTREVSQAANFGFSVLSVNPKVSDGVELSSGNLSLFDAGVGAEVCYSADYDTGNVFDGLTVSLKGGGTAAIFGAGRSTYWNTDIEFPRAYGNVLQNSSTGLSGMAGGENSIRLGPTAMAQDAITAMNEALASAVGEPLMITTTECRGQGFNLSLGLDLEAALGVGVGVQLGVTGKYFDEIQFPRKVTALYPGNMNYLLSSAEYTSAMESDNFKDILEELLEGTVPLIKTALLNAINIFDDLIEAGEEIVVAAVDKTMEVVGEVAGTLDDAGTLVVSTFETGLSMLNPLDKPSEPRTVRRMYWSPMVLHRMAGAEKAAVEPAGNGTVLVVVSDAMHVEFIPKGASVAADSLPSPVDVKMVIRDRNLEKNLFTSDDRNRVALYYYDETSRYWIRENGSRRADTLLVNTTRTGTWALGVEVTRTDDSSAPEILETGPRGTVMTRTPEIYARIRDGEYGSGVDLSRTRIVVDADTLITTHDPVNDRLSGTPLEKLTAGDHTVTVIAVDNVGNARTTTFTFTVSGMGVNEEPRRFSVSAPYPNPFNPVTVIRFTIPEDGPIDFAVYDVRGAKIAMLASGFRKAGTYDVRWDGHTSDGVPAASGVYLYRLRAGTHEAQGKLMLMK